MCDHTSVINLTKNIVLYSCTKHIEIHHQFLHDHVEKMDVIFEHVDSKNQLPDIFIKPLATEPFINIRGELGIIDISNVDQFYLVACTLYLYSNSLFEYFTSCE